MKIAVWGYGRPVIDTIKILKDSRIEIAYVKADYRRAELDQFAIELQSVGKYSLYVENIPEVEVDLIFTINYNRIISEEILDKYSIVNYHVGLLPMWRGNSANGWGVINGASAVGYTIHKMVPMLDAGPIYYQFSYPYMEGDTYVKGRTAMAEDLKMNLANILEGIHDRSISAKEQVGSYTYCATFRPIDGFIDWTDSSDTILRKFFVFGPPLGTGLKFTFKGQTYAITQISKIADFAPTIGVPGSVIYKWNNSIWIKTGDTAVAIEEILLDNTPVDLSKTFIIGQRFDTK